MVIDEPEDPVDELLSLVVAHFTKRDVTAEMIVAVGVATWAAERAFAGDFDREGRGMTRKDSAPGRYDTVHSSHYSSPFAVLFHSREHDLDESVGADEIHADCRSRG